MGTIETYTKSEVDLLIDRAVRDVTVAYEERMQSLLSQYVPLDGSEPMTGELNTPSVKTVDINAMVDTININAPFINGSGKIKSLTPMRIMNDQGFSVALSSVLLTDNKDVLFPDQSGNVVVQ